MQHGERRNSLENFRIVCASVKERHVGRLPAQERVNAMPLAGSALIASLHRGVLKQGMWADVAVIDPPTLRGLASFSRRFRKWQWVI